MSNLTGKDNRLSFIKHEDTFATRGEACGWIFNQIYEGKVSPLLGEPMLLFYDSGERKPSGEWINPNVILAIGNEGDGVGDGNVFIIDIKKSEENIEELREKVKELARNFYIVPKDSETVHIATGKTVNPFGDEGVLISADTRISEVEGNMLINKTDGLYIFADLDYNKETGELIFKVNGTAKKTLQLPKDQHVKSGVYDYTHEQIVLTLADDSTVKIPVDKLIEEWKVLPDGMIITKNASGETQISYTPIVLKKKHVGSDEAGTIGNIHVYDWQDILSADVRVGEQLPRNILHKTPDGRYLYVKGTADNIYYKANMTVEQAIDAIDTGISTSNGNLIYKKNDGIFAYAKLDYDRAANAIKFTYSDGNDSGALKTETFELNNFRLLDDVSYDPLTENIIIRYINEKGEYKKVEIPASSIIREWEVQNDSHNVKLTKSTSVLGKDLLSADAKISTHENNILTEVDHALFVEGTARNIKYDVTGKTTVKNLLDDLSGVTIELADDIDSLSAVVDTKVDGVTGELPIDVDNTDENNPIIKLKLSAADGNILKVDALDNGLYTSVDLEHAYNSATCINTLTFTVNGEEKVIEIQSGSVIKEVYYDPTTEELVIKYIADGIEKESRTPFSPIIEEWTTNEHNIPEDSLSSGITLERSRSVEGKDVLSAAINVSKEPNNIFELKNGLAYAEGSGITKNAADIATLRTDLDAEIVRAEAKEDDLQNAIDAEEERATAKENALSEAISTEKAERETADNALSDAINTEKAERIAADNALQTAIDAEVTRATAKEGELQEAIDAEEARAKGVEANLQAELDRTQAGAGLDDRGDYHVDPDDCSILNGATSLKDADKKLGNAICKEIADREAADDAIQTNVGNEAQARENADEALQDAIDAEAQARENADEALQDAIDAEAQARETADDTLNDALTAETAARQAEDIRLNNLITAETANREAEDADIWEQVKKNQLDFERSDTIEFKRFEGDEPSTTHKVKANVRIVSGETSASLGNIIKVGESGIYAQAEMSYDPATNIIYFFNSNMTEPTQYRLNAGSLIDGMEIVDREIPGESTQKFLVITYHTAALPEPQKVEVNLTRMFNPIMAENASEGSAIELTSYTKNINGVEYTAISGRTLITHDETGDYKDNIIRIANNGLYVPGSGITKAQETADCAIEAVTTLAKTTLGDINSGTCGDNYGYVPVTGNCIINSATSLYDADRKIADKVCEHENEINFLSGRVDCVVSGVNAANKVIGIDIPECGGDVEYPVISSGCVISAATSMYDADRLLDEAVCALKNDRAFILHGRESSTVHIESWIDPVVNETYISATTRLSHAVSHDPSGMDDADLVITALTDSTFSNTNVLRYVEIEGEQEDSRYNGLYLSNIWDCGDYDGTDPRYDGEVVNPNYSNSESPDYEP